MMTGVTVRRPRSKLRPIALCGLLVALPLAAAWAKNQKPDPDGLPPHDVKDLHYGDVLFYFYQDDYFDSITRLLAAQQLERLPHTEGEAELLLGGLYLSLGEHVEAGKIFEALLAGKVSEAVRNKAWFYLGKVWYQRGYLDESERALRQVSDKIQPRISAERYMLLAQLKLREGRYDEAIAALQSWHGAPDWTAYAQFNLGVALVRKDRLPEAIAYLDRVGRMETRYEELLSLRDKANLALGFAYLQAKRPADAKPILERVRLEGPFSSMALLGVGWADSALGQFKQALVPWLALRKRNLLDAAVQESYLTVPYAYNQLGAPGQAAEYYSAAIDSFDVEFKRIDDSIAQIRAGDLLDRLLKEDKKDTLTWYWQLKTLPDAPESRYLYQLLASNEFQEGLKNYRELKFMSRNIDDWRESVAAYTNMLDTRQHAYDEEVPKADAVMAATDLDALTQQAGGLRVADQRDREVQRCGGARHPRRAAHLGAHQAHRRFRTDASGRSGPRGNARQSASAERRDVLAAVRELQGAALERAALGQGARGLPHRDAEARRPGSPGARRRADQHRRVRRPRRGDECADGPAAGAPRGTHGQAGTLPAGSRDRGAGTAAAAHRDLSSSGPLRARRDLRQDREQAGGQTTGSPAAGRLGACGQAEG